jgi:hypothetical protein
MLFMMRLMYTSLREIVKGDKKFSGDKMFFDSESVLRHLSVQLANSSSHYLFKVNADVYELQVALGSGRQISRWGFFRSIHDIFNAPDMTYQQDPPQVAMSAVPAPHPQGFSQKGECEPAASSTTVQARL